MTDLLTHFHTRLDDMLALLTTLVEHETPSADKAAVDAMGRYLADWCRAHGAVVMVEPRDAVGDLVLAKWNADAPGAPILALMHMDTVWPLGTLAARPLRREGDRLYGPGAVDMKGGIAVFLSAVKELRALGRLPQRPVWALFTPDEETGSEHSSAYLIALAREAGLVLVMEPPLPGEALKTARKAVGTYTVTVHGRASHAGNAPEAGVNATVELAHQIVAISAMGDPARGTTVTPTVIQGGVASNVVPDVATVLVDVRAARDEERQRVERAMQGLTPVLDGITIQIAGGFDRPAMVRDARMAATFGQAAQIAAQVGLSPLTEGAAGGGSDGNFTAAAGVPTLDGLGAAGDGAHAVDEYVAIDSLPRRAMLVAGLLLHWPDERGG